MRFARCHLVTSLLALLIGSASAASAQQAVGTPVDRNVGDTGSNAASQRLTQPGIGQFGVGSLLLDRYGGSATEPSRFDPFAGDARVSNRQQYILQSPGVTALIDRPDYVGPSPQGGWVFNAQTFDGTEILTLSGANTVFVLNHDLLGPRPLSSEEAARNDHPNRYQPMPLSRDADALMRDSRVTGQRQLYTPVLRPTNSTYRHPEIIERQRKLREERKAEQAAKAAAVTLTEEQAQPADQNRDATPVDDSK